MKSWQLLSGPIFSLALLAGNPAFAADDSHCTSVTDSAARLACYDAAHNLHPNIAAVRATPSPASSSKPVAPTAEPAQVAQSAFGLPPKVDQRKEARRLTATVVALQNVKHSDTWIDWRDARATAYKLLDATLRGIVREKAGAHLTSATRGKSRKSSSARR